MEMMRTKPALLTFKWMVEKIVVKKPYILQ